MDSNGWQKPSRCALLNPADSLTRGLCFCPLMIEGQGDLLWDSSGCNNHGAPTYGGTWTSTPYGWGIDFDGSDDGATFGTGCSKLWAGGGTAIILLQPDSGGVLNNGRVVGKGLLGATPGWNIYTHSEVELRFRANRATTHGIWISMGLNSGWSHAALTYNSDDVANDPLFYLDGVPDTSIGESSTPVGAYWDDSAAMLTVGNNEDGEREYDGQQAGVWLWDRILTASEIRQHAVSPWGMFARQTNAGVYYVTRQKPTGGRKPIRIAA